MKIGDFVGRPLLGIPKHLRYHLFITISLIWMVGFLWVLTKPDTSRYLGIAEAFGMYVIASLSILFSVLAIKERDVNANATRKGWREQPVLMVGLIAVDLAALAVVITFVVQMFRKG